MLSATLRRRLPYQPFSTLPAGPRPCLPAVRSLQAQPGRLPFLVSCHASEHCQSLQDTIQAIFDLFISVLALNVLSPFVPTVLEHLSHGNRPFICSWPAHNNSAAEIRSSVIIHEKQLLVPWILLWLYYNFLAFFSSWLSSLLSLYITHCNFLVPSVSRRMIYKKALS